MDVQEILQHLDELFAKQDISSVEPFMTQQLEDAYRRKDYNTCVTILNELIGFFRDISQYDKSLSYCQQVLVLMQQMGLEGTLPYATTMLNVANALRAAGRHKESLAFYEGIFPIYQKELEPEDERNASLFNNLSLLYQEMQDFEAAVACQKKALEIITLGDDTIKIAITHSNLGASLLQLGKVEEAVSHLQTALEIFNRSEEKDFHYNAAMAALGSAYYALGKSEDARNCYLIALKEQYKHCGKSEGFYRILSNLHLVEQELGIPKTDEDAVCDKGTDAHIKGLDLSEMFYEEVAKEAILSRFQDYFPRMSIGLVGEGSECFGFDDVISTDHDFGPGFCIWLNRADYEQIGAPLQRLYDALPKTYKGYTRLDKCSTGRVGVWCIDDFFQHYAGYEKADDIPDDDHVLAISDDGMATILNGRLFHDSNHQFQKRRLAFYEAFSDKIWNVKIARALIQLGQYGQSNYPRAMKRQDYVTAQITLYKYVETLLQLVHYINHVFPPYYKWLRVSASTMPRMAVLADLTNALADFADGRAAWQEDASGSTDKVTGTIEVIAQLIIRECGDMGLLDGLDIPKEEQFLEVYGRGLYAECVKQNADDIRQKQIEELVSLEWQAFDEVQNEGGRAQCQDDFGTFSIMRKSQYMTWTGEMLKSYIQDFHAANARGWNLITEKYGRMMASTHPSEYAKIAHNFPTLSHTQKTIIEQIVSVQVGWMEEFAREYPKMAFNSRSIHTYEDTPWNTSYETYLRGELSTYSPATLKLYGAFIVELAKRNQNLAKLTMTNTALLYGYESLEDAEKRL